MSRFRFSWLLIPAFFLLEVVLMNHLSRPDNFPLSLNPIEALSGIAFTLSYFHIPVVIAFALAVLILVIPAWLITRLVMWGVRSFWQKLADS
ncbi:hypothetical protein [uncultured Endozoicomonas sp.]|uniref:hypothetical protein n=1 Tax=uncultured Endozoicomonas sp. TaxID=432652 RepID=UPI002609AE1E|nr:hypothetical protein [uncultured Endozoicomonas sp.]